MGWKLTQGKREGFWLKCAKWIHCRLRKVIQPLEKSWIPGTFTCCATLVRGQRRKHVKITLEHSYNYSGPSDTLKCICPCIIAIELEPIQPRRDSFHPSLNSNPLSQQGTLELCCCSANTSWILEANRIQPTAGKRMPCDSEQTIRKRSNGVGTKGWLLRIFFSTQYGNLLDWKLLKSLKSFKSLKTERILREELSQYLEIFVQDLPPLVFTDSNEKLGSVSSSPINISVSY